MFALADCAGFPGCISVGGMGDRAGSSQSDPGRCARVCAGGRRSFGRAQGLGTQSVWSFGKSATSDGNCDGFRLRQLRTRRDWQRSARTQRSRRQRGVVWLSTRKAGLPGAELLLRRDDWRRSREALASRVRARLFRRSVSRHRQLFAELRHPQRLRRGREPRGAGPVAVGGLADVSRRRCVPV
jgi:hypothetical protein